MLSALSNSRFLAAVVMALAVWMTLGYKQLLDMDKDLALLRQRVERLEEKR